MPRSLANLTMSTQESDGSLTAETPDRSLGSLSLNATGEQLDDIQVNLDRMYLDSPAPSSLLFGSSSDGAVSSVSNPIAYGGGNIGHGRKLPLTSDATGFDDLQILEIEDISEVIGCTDWLCDIPSGLPNNFCEDDRSFLDTGLLNIRFSLLNYVTHAITEEAFAETKRNLPAIGRSNLASEAAGSGATFKVIRPTNRSQMSTMNLSRNSSGASFSENGEGIVDSWDDQFCSNMNGDKPFQSLGDSISPIKLGNCTNQLGRKFLQGNTEQAPQTMSNRVMELRRRMQQQHQQRPLYDNGDENQVSDQSCNNKAHDETYSDPSYASLAQSQPSSTRIVNYGNASEAFQRGVHVPTNQTVATNDKSLREMISESISPVSSPDQHKYQKRSSGWRPAVVENGYASNIPGAVAFTSENSSSCEDTSINTTGSFLREIDTRTYTRPKKSRMAISSTVRSQLNTTMELSPNQSGSGGEFSPQRTLNTTISLSPDRSPIMGSFAGSPNKLNTTISISPDRSGPGELLSSQLNKTMDLSSPELKNHVGAIGAPASTTPANLNETFVAENGDSSSSEKSRRVTRNLSYVIRRDEESPNNNSSPQVSANTSRCDLNSTFSYDPDADREVQVTRSSRNTSMEDLNSRVASQIRSLGCSTITRGRYSDHGGRGVVSNLDETRLVARTSSTDTYSVAHSSESPTSSGLSSPMDAQSYDDIQSSSEAVRRSMPNLAIRNATGIRPNLVFPQTGSGQLRKNHYISDSRLSHLGSGENRSRLRVHGSESTSTSSFNQGLSVANSPRTRGGSNTSTPAALNRISSGINTGTTASRVYSAQTLGSTGNSRASTMNRPQGSSMGNVRTTGMTVPRYTSGLRPPRPTNTSAVITQQLTNSTTTRNTTAPGIPVPTFRSQSRIPAPGQFRFSRPSQVNPSNRLGGPTSKGTSASHKGPVEDWRDGCY